MKNLWILYCSYFVIILQEDVTQLTEGAGVDLELPFEATIQMVCIHINKLYIVERMSVCQPRFLIFQNFTDIGDIHPDTC